MGGGMSFFAISRNMVFFLNVLQYHVAICMIWVYHIEIGWVSRSNRHLAPPLRTVRERLAAWDRNGWKGLDLS